MEEENRKTASRKRGPPSEEARPTRNTRREVKVAETTSVGRGSGTATDRNPTTTTQSTAATRLTDLGHWDVILGRGSYNSWRPGHARLHVLVDRFMSQYNSAANRMIKTRIIQDIYDDLKSRGRFMAKDPDTGKYNPVSEQFAKRKIAHAFRDRRRKDRLQSTPKVQGVARRSSQSTSEEENDDEEQEEDSKMPANEMPEPAHPEPPPHGDPPSPQDPQPAPQPDSSDESAPAQGQQQVEGTGSPSSGSSLFSDQDLLSVLGTPSEYNNPKRTE